jgi:hypothetical protein
MKQLTFGSYRAAMGAVVAMLGLGLGLDASATPPASVVGSWVATIDGTATTIDITAQGGGGGPGGSACRLIVGSLGIAPLRGYYCLDTGEVAFLHNNLDSGLTVRTFSGSVSMDALGVTNMAGTFRVMNIAFGPFGEFPFWASK